MSTIHIYENSFGTEVYLSEDSHYFKLTNNVEFHLIKNYYEDKKLKLDFLIYTKTSKTLVLTKSYDFTLGRTSTIWTGGTVEEGNQDVDNNYYNKSDMDIKKEQDNSNVSDKVVPSYSNSDISFDDINGFNFNDILKMCSNGFALFKTLFSILPDFVWGLMTTFIIICIILRLIGK